MVVDVILIVMLYLFFVFGDYYVVEVVLGVGVIIDEIVVVIVYLVVLVGIQGGVVGFGYLFVGGECCCFVSQGMFYGLFGIQVLWMIEVQFG